MKPNIFAVEELLHPAVKASMGKGGVMDHPELVQALEEGVARNASPRVSAAEALLRQGAAPELGGLPAQGHPPAGYPERTGPQPNSPEYRQSIQQLVKDDKSVAAAVIPGYLEGLPVYQQDNRNMLGGYLNNPFDEEGRALIGRQFWNAPLGGHVRRGLAGQEVFGHTITGGQARAAEQALAGLTAVGVGVPTFMAALNGLTTPQSQDTIPM